MAFSADRALPSSVLRLELAAAPGSLCAIHAVDRSMLLLKPKDELNTEAVSGGPFCSPRDQLVTWGEEMTLAWSTPMGTRCHGGSWTARLPGRGRCLAGFVSNTHVYSQVYKALPEFNYPGSIQDPEFCSVSSWDHPPLLPRGREEQDKFRLPGGHHTHLPFRRDSQRDSYKLFQVKALPWFLIQAAAEVCCGCWESTTAPHESHAGAKGPSLSHGPQAPLIFCRPVTPCCWDGGVPPAGFQRWTTLFSFSQDAALKLFTNTKTRDDCKKVFGLPGPIGQHSPQPARSTEPSWRKAQRAGAQCWLPCPQEDLESS